jgi:hypothetical protein
VIERTRQQPYSSAVLHCSLRHRDVRTVEERIVMVQIVGRKEGKLVNGRQDIQERISLKID